MPLHFADWMGTPESKIQGMPSALNARMLGTPLHWVAVTGEVVAVTGEVVTVTGEVVVVTGEVAAVTRW